MAAYRYVILRHDAIHFAVVRSHMLFIFKERVMGQRLNIIFVSEGAIDTKGNPITATEVQQVFNLISQT